jgi:hypothetical protein
VHALLRYLEEAGFPGAPRALGFDSSGREMLSYLPGETIGDRMPWPAWVSADSMLVQVGQWLRRLHDLTAGFRPPPGERWFIGGVMQPGLIAGHQDAAPYNAVVDGERLVGVLRLGYRRAVVAGVGSGLLDAPLGVARVAVAVAVAGPAGPAGSIGRGRCGRAGCRRAAAAGDPVSVALLPIAGLLESSAVDVEALPRDFWLR